MTNDETSSTLVNVVFSGNSVDDSAITSPPRRGGGGLLNFDADAFLTNVVFSGNTSTTDGGAIWNRRRSIEVANSIFWENAAEQDDLIYNDDGGTVRVSYSLIDGSLPAFVEDGGGNNHGDPLFVDSDGKDDIAGTVDDDVHLLSASPAIDAGNAAFLPSDAFDLDGDGDRAESIPVDLDGNARVHDERGGGKVLDMGAYEFGASRVVNAIERFGPPRIDNHPHLEIYPNPFRETAMLVLESSHAARVTVTMYDLLGRRVRLVYDGQVVGSKRIRLDGTELSNGVYILRVIKHASLETYIITRYQ